MPNIGPLEIVIVLIIVLVLFGAKRIPELGRSMGKGLREFRGSLAGKDDDEEAEPKPEGASDEEVGKHPTVKAIESEVGGDRRS